MRRETAPALALALAVGLAIVAGLWAVGGPATGAQEKRDATRLRDLNSLASKLICQAQTTDRTLPEALPGPDAPQPCPPAARQVDPYTGQPYRYERISPTGFRLCAGFERPDLIDHGSGLDAETGCLTRVYTPY